MEIPDKTIWTPDGETLSDALLTKLGARLGIADYDALYRFSIEQPQAYWEEVIGHLQFDWDQPFTQFCDASGDPQLPQWFTGGRLNWTSMVMKLAQEPASSGRTAIIAEDESGEVETLRYAELAALVLRLAGGLRAQGVRSGGRVGLMLPMGVAAVASLLAIAALGAICVPLFTGFAPEAVVARLALAEADHLVVSGGFHRRGKFVSSRDLLAEVKTRMPALRIVGDVRDLAAHAAPIAQVQTMEANDPFMIVFTSGTTGQPKGTVHTHAGFPLKILHDCAYHFELRPGDVWLWPSDMGWIVGPITTVGALCRGATLVCYDGAPDHPTASRLASLIDRHGVTHFGASPTLIRSLATHPAADVMPARSTLKLLMVAGEVIDPGHFEWFARCFGRTEAPVINYSGGTEASGAILANVPVRPIKASGFNSASPGVAAFAADANGQRVRGEVGELTIANPFIGMTHGFWNDKPRYLETYWSAVPGVWTHGDLVQEDRDGHFFILGRSDDTLKIAGKRVGPAEVESAVLALAEIKDAAAIGLADAAKGQRLVICVVPCAAAPFSAQAVARMEALVASHVQAALGKPFAPAKVFCVADLPRTRNGKVMRRVIRRLLSGQVPGDLSALDNAASIEIFEALGAGLRA